MAANHLDRLAAVDASGAGIVTDAAVAMPLPQPDGGSAERRYLLLAAPDPRSLLETDPAALARDLQQLPFSEVLAYLEALRTQMLADAAARREAASQASAMSRLDPGSLALMLDWLPSLLEPGPIAEAVDRELGVDGIPGRAYLDGWVPSAAAMQRGMTTRIADQLFQRAEDTLAPAACLRAMPTRQLHIAAGNSPVIAMLSLLRGIATKGACVVKSPAEAIPLVTLLAESMHALDPRHPITRHTSLVYWRGGDRAVEDVLFADGAFDRLVVWGSPRTVASVRTRAGQAKTIFLNPRYGLSLIGREAFDGDLVAVARRACTDSLIGNQGACTASLVHYVEADETRALEYCEALREALAEFDRALPQAASPVALGRLRRLRRGALLRRRWFENGKPPHIRSAVVYLRESFDLAQHPMSRCIVVRRVERADDALARLNPAVSTLGVYPEALRERVRDVAAMAGVSNVLPLGECERAYAGMPHDGMRVLSELVSWVNA